MILFSTQRSLECILYSSTRSTLTKRMVLILIGTALLGVAGQLAIPLRPIPLTFQSSAVILLGLLYGSRLGASTVLAYLVAGFAGVPLFAEFSGGPHILLGPTAGYLLGFLPAAYVSGYLAEHGLAKNFLGTFIAACIGAFIIFLSGLLVLTFHIGWQGAFATGVQPFLFTEPLKLLALALIVPRFWRSR